MSGFNKRIDARIEVLASYGDTRVVGTIAIWEGGEIAGISKEFLEDADGRFVQRDGDFIQIGDLRVQIVDFDERAYLVKKANADANSLV